MVLTKMTEEERIRNMEIPSGKLPLIIDSDAKNETDDQFAIAWALLSCERFSVEAVYAAPFCYDCIKPGIPGWDTHPILSRGWTPETGMRASYDEIQKIYGLLGLDSEGNIFYGSDRYMTDSGRPVESDAVRDLIRRARACEGLLYIAAIGVPTNIASAILLAPDIIDKIVVVWLGGELPCTGHGEEFNMMQDVRASQIILDCGVPLIWIPCREVASVLTLTGRETKERLAGKNPICDYLAEIILDAMRTDEQWEQQNAPGQGMGCNQSAHPAKEEEHSRIIWDIAAIAALKDPAYGNAWLISAPVLSDDLSLTETHGRHMIKMVTSCSRNAIFDDMYSKLLSE